MDALIFLACCLAAWPIHLFVVRPLLHLFKILD